MHASSVLLQCFLADRFDDFIEKGQQTILLLRQPSVELIGVGSAHCSKGGRYLQMFNERPDLFVFLQFSLFLPISPLYFAVKLRVGINGKHIGSNQCGMELVADVRC